MDTMTHESSTAGSSTVEAIRERLFLLGASLDRGPVGARRRFLPAPRASCRSAQAFYRTPAASSRSGADASGCSTHSLSPDADRRARVTWSGPRSPIALLKGMRDRHPLTAKSRPAEQRKALCASIALQDERRSRAQRLPTFSEKSLMSDEGLKG
jgi:hypothetical protein